MRLALPRQDESVEDIDALVRVRSGDAAAFDELYARHVVGARRLARSLLRDVQAGEDAVAEAFTQTYAAIQRGRGPVDGFDRYLHRSVRHHCMRTWRRQDRQRPVEERVVDRYLPPTPDGVDDRLDQELLRQAYGDLPAKMRLVLWRTEVEGCSHPEIAQQIHSTPAAVAALAMRARRELARRYLQRHVAATAPANAACSDVRDDLADAVRGAISPRRGAEIDDHLAECAPCRGERRDLEHVNGRLRSSPLGILLEAVIKTPLLTLVPRIGGLVAVAASAGPAVAILTLTALVLTAAAAADTPGRGVAVATASPVGAAPAGTLSRTLDASDVTASRTFDASERSEPGPVPSAAGVAMDNLVDPELGPGADVPGAGPPTVSLPDLTALILGALGGAADALPLAGGLLVAVGPTPTQTVDRVGAIAGGLVAGIVGGIIAPIAPPLAEIVSEGGTDGAGPRVMPPPPPAPPTSSPAPPAPPTTAPPSPVLAPVISAVLAVPVPTAPTIAVPPIDLGLDVVTDGVDGLTDLVGP